MGGHGGSGGSKQTRAQRDVAGAGGLRRAANQLPRAQWGTGKMIATNLAYQGASKSQATQIATGQLASRANVSGSRTGKLPAIHVTVDRAKSGKVSMGVSNGRNRLAAARKAGATHIRAEVHHSRQTASGKWITRVSTQNLKI